MESSKGVPERKLKEGWLAKDCERATERLKSLDAGKMRRDEYAGLETYEPLIESVKETLRSVVKYNEATALRVAKRVIKEAIAELRRG